MATKRMTDVDIIDSLNSNESFFVNQNNTIKQINKSNIVFGINNGGTNATNIEDARTNLDVYSKSEVDNAISVLNIATITSDTITIPESKWVQNSAYDDLYYADMSGSVPNVDENSIVFVSPVHSPISNFDAYVVNNVRACEQSLNTINFVADIKPEIDIIVNYIVFVLRR